MIKWPGKNWIFLDTDAVPTALYDVQDLAHLHEDITAPAMYRISENVAPVNAGIVIFVAVPHTDADWRQPDSARKYLDQRLSQLLHQANVERHPGTLGAAAEDVPVPVIPTI